MTIYNYSTQEGEKFWGVSSYLGINPQTGQQVNCYKQGFKTKSQAVKYLNQEKFFLILEYISLRIKIILFKNYMILGLTGIN